MKQFFATIYATTENQKREFERDLSRSGVLLRVMTPDGNSYHYSLEGDWEGYKELLQIAGRPDADDQYKLTSLEHFEE